MALIACKECGSQVSTEAKSCPKCGAKVIPPTPLWKWVVAGVVCVSMFKCIFDSNDRAEANRNAQPSTTSTEQIRREAEFQRVVSIIKAMKAGMKNPASFEFVDATLIGDTVCIIYRGTNSFNAVITQHSAIRKDFKVGDWNKECAGKSGTDYSHAKYAL